MGNRPVVGVETIPRWKTLDGAPRSTRVPAFPRPEDRILSMSSSAGSDDPTYRFRFVLFPLIESPPVSSLEF